MKVNNVALTGTTSQTIESRAMKLLFICSAAKAARTDAKDILTDLANAKVEIEKQTANGGQPIIPELPFVDLLEIAAANEGSLDIRTEGANFVLRATVELSDMGAIELAENEFFKAILTGFTDVSVDIYAIDADETTVIHNVYKTLFLNAHTPKNVDVNFARWMAVPDASIKKVELLDAQGRITTYEKEELRQLCNEGNEAAAVVDGKIYPGYLNLLVINVANAQSARVTTSANASIYLVNYEAL